MNKMRIISIPLLALTLFSSSTLAFAAEKSSYAESLYADYVTYSGDAIAFSVSEKSNGSTRYLKHAQVRDFIAPAVYNVSFDQSPDRLQHVEFNSQSADTLQFLNSNVLSDYDAEGFPVEEGTYRILSIKVRIGHEERFHEALELCWHNQGKCTLIDAGVQNLEAAVQNIRRIKASDWAPIVHGKTEENLTGAEKATTLRCRVASDTSLSSKTWTVPAETLNGPKTCGVSTPCYKIEVPRLQMGIRCSVNSQGMCVANGWHDAPVARFVRNRGSWSFACDGKGLNRAQDSNTRELGAGSGCGVKSGLNADVTFAINFCGSGASVSVCPSSNGTKYYTGRDVSDSCVFTAVQ